MIFGVGKGYRVVLIGECGRRSEGTLARVTSLGGADIGAIAEADSLGTEAAAARVEGAAGACLALPDGASFEAFALVGARAN